MQKFHLQFSQYPAAPTVTNEHFALSMCFSRVLAGNQSLFYFKMGKETAGFSNPADPGTLLKFYLDAPNASDLFGFLDQNVNREPKAPQSITVQTSDATGAYTGTCTVSFKAIQTDPHSAPSGAVLNFNVQQSDNSNNQQAVAFALSWIDTTSFFIYFNDMLWSNPPNPPH